ncbi:sensor histidine kinase [Marinimicrobium alkaliphilum]|uniref:sensor histidine kinase n=1 Tax=Marinimicrobium alkaliphilum TaxID=2202654 RepID=UPI000DB936BB|nr:HAMP domain-containing sensor histidine kinase [Marinimicrobium alkaliphilum]
MLTPSKKSLRNIRTSLLVFVLLPFLAIIIASGWYGLHQLEKTAQTNMEQDIQLIARAIRPALSHALQYGHTATLRRTITSAFDMDQVYGVYVYNREGQRISAIGIRDAQVPGQEAADLASVGDEQGAFEQIGDEEVFSYFMPLVDSGGRIIGLLQVTRRGQDFAHELDQFRWRALGLLIASSLLVIAVIWFGYQRAVGRHLQTLGQAMEQVGQGDMAHRIPPRGPDEIRFLTQGINRMLDSIVASEEQLSAQRERELALKTRLHHSEKLAAIGRFAAGVAHELGTPLSVADGKAQRALRKADPETAESFEQIRQQLRRVERIIRQLMDFARPVVPEKREVRMTDLVQSAQQQVSEEAERQQARLVLPAQPYEIVLRADRLRLEQALINLLRNGLQAASGGEVHLNWHTVDDTQLCLRVEDNGPGIADEDIGHLLEPFYTTKPVGQGTGLGLAVVNAVVNEHGGRIEIGHSDLGGARFDIYLPMNGATTQEGDA